MTACPIPNTNIASNLGPQIDPKDIDYLEVQRGSYDAEYGDRTYGIFNIVPRTGFERDNEAELVTIFGNWYQTNDQFNFGGHTKRFAYYASLNGNRSDYGLQPPIGQVVHDAENGYGGFASFIFNASPSNQFRLIASLRQDYYQIPIDPDPNSSGNQVYPSYGLHDSEREPDGYVTFSWVHTFNPNLLLTVSPFYHYNQASYNSSPNDFPVITNVNQTAHYAGAQASLNATVLKNNDIQVGVYGFAQHQSNFFNNVFTDCGTELPELRPLFGRRYRRTGRGVCQRPVQGNLVADADRRPSLFALRFRLSQRRNPAGRRGERARPALWRRHQNPAPELGLSGLLRGVLPTASALDGYRSTDRLGQQPEPDFRRRCEESAITNTSSAWRFLFAVGCSTSTRFKPARGIGWTTAISANQISSGRSPGTTL